MYEQQVTYNRRVLGGSGQMFFMLNEYLVPSREIERQR